MEKEKTLKKTKEEKKYHCRSVLHQLWFRILLVIASIGMITFGFCYMIGLNVLDFIPHPFFLLRMIIGVLYIITSLFIIHVVLEYEKEKHYYTYICHRCASPLGSENEEDGEKEA